MPYTIAFDPGEASGITVGYFDDERPWEIVAATIVTGGAEGLRDFLLENHSHLAPEGLRLQDFEHVICERFVPDGTPGARLTVSPQGEGVVLALFPHTEVHWQLRTAKTVGMKNRPAADERMKQLGVWTAAGDVQHTDGRDANDATLHSIAYMKAIRHRPTISWWTSPPAPRVEDPWS